MKYTKQDILSLNHNRNIGKKKWRATDSAHHCEMDYLVDCLDFLVEMRKDRINAATSRGRADRLAEKLEALMKTIEQND